MEVSEGESAKPVANLVYILRWQRMLLTRTL